MYFMYICYHWRNKRISYPYPYTHTYQYII